MYRKGFVLGLSLLLAGCFPVKKIDVNGLMIKSPVVLDNLQGKQGMPCEDVFLKINVDKMYCDLLSTQEVQERVYGKAEIRGSNKEIEDFKDKKVKLDGYNCGSKYINTKRYFELHLLRATDESTGHDLRVVVICEDKKLFSAKAEGRAIVNDKVTTYVWDLISGVLTGAVPEGGKSAVKGLSGAL